MSNQWIYAPHYNHERGWRSFIYTLTHAVGTGFITEHDMYRIFASSVYRDQWNAGAALRAVNNLRDRPNRPLRLQVYETLEYIARHRGARPAWLR